MFDVTRENTARDILVRLDVIVKSDMDAVARTQFYGGEAEEALEDLVWLAGQQGQAIPAELWDRIMAFDPAFAKVYERGKAHRIDLVAA